MEDFKLSTEGSGSKPPKVDKDKVLQWMRAHKIATVLLFLILLGAVGSFLSPTSSTPSTSSVTQASQSSSVSVGQQGTIHSPQGGTDDVPVFLTKAALDTFIKAAVAHDDVGTASVIANGDGFFVKDGTKVLVIDSAYGESKFRILDGQYQNAAAWLPYEFIK